MASTRDRLRNKLNNRILDGSPDSEDTTITPNTSTTTYGTTTAALSSIPENMDDDWIPEEMKKANTSQGSGKRHRKRKSRKNHLFQLMMSNIVS